MLAQRYIGTVQQDRTIRLTDVEFEPGTEVEVIVLPNDDDMAESHQTMLLGAAVFNREWAEDEEG